MPNNHRNASRGVRNRNRTLSEETVQIAGMTVTIMRKPIKNMYLRIKPPNAQIVISTPSRMSQAAIARFVTERKSWIEQAQRAMLQARDQQIHEGNNPNDPHSFTWNDATRKRAVQTINAQLPVLLAKWSPIIGREPTHVTLRVMTSRWGSCTPKTGRIRLNLQLGLMDPRFLEYVLVHENAPVGKRARRGLSAAYECIFAAMEAITAGVEPSRCTVTLAMLLRCLRC